VPRGGRRRRGRGGKGRQNADRKPAAQGAQPVKQDGQTQPPGGTGRRKRRRRRGPPRETGVASMINRPKTLNMLPSDGVELEELISNLQEEYGTPATPQPFRLTIKLIPAEESTAVSSREDSGGVRTRRRRRRPGGGTAAEVTEITAEPEDPADPQEIPPA